MLNYTGLSRRICAGVIALGVGCAALSPAIAGEITETAKT